MTHLRRHWLWLLIVVPAALGLWRLRFDVEVLNLLPEKSPVVQGLKLYQQNFANARELIITLQAPDADTAESSARAIATAMRARKELIAEATWTPPWIEHPGQAAELVAFLWLNQPPAIFGQLTNRLSGPGLAQILNESREALATSLSPNDVAMRGYDPLGLLQLPGTAPASAFPFGSGSKYFASSDEAFRVVFVEASTDLVSYKKCIKWFEEVKRVVESARSAAGIPATVTVKYTGRPAFVAEIGSGMERDLAGPSVATLAVIALLFYLTHRCWRPLLWMLALLVLILAGTLALGGLFYGTLNVVSLGFASILLGLAEDFGIVLYQESQTHPRHSLSQIRREAMPGIFWSAVTTAGAFLLLNLSGLPGLGQLGTLVAIGVTVAAFVMLFAYLPPLLNSGARRGITGNTNDASAPVAHGLVSRARRFPSLLTMALVAGGLLVLWRIPPQFDHSPDALKPRNSEAYAALDEIKVRMNRPKDPLWVVITGNDESAISRRLTAIEPVLQRAVSDGTIAEFTLPSKIWPHSENQIANRETARLLAARRASVSQSILASGFTTNSIAITEAMLGTWDQAGQATQIFWPTNDNSRWILEKLVARNGPELLAIGLLHLDGPGAAASLDKLSALSTELQRHGVWLSGWDLLGPAISKLVRTELFLVLIPILVLVLITLWLAFRSWRDALLSLATLAVSGLGLHVIMVLMGWRWNMMNLMALPLLLGMGVDFSIHIQLALRRHGGNTDFVRRSIGRALLLAGSTTVAGFASLGFASNAGIAALGKVCAAGIICAMLSAVYLLPDWWRLAVAKKTSCS
jgi:predicted RND superfamily exporter protein